MPPSPATIRRRLLRWFDRNRRDLPWRQSRHPYPIWVSEVLLQQTQVSTVVPFYERFLQAFPTVADLAAADLQDVLRLWEGLGYYRRARDLHRAARIIVDEHRGQFPTEAADWSRLPGVGRYMVGAVLSQAFDQRLPIVEANSQRVLLRLFGQAGDPARCAGRRWLWHKAETLLPRRRVGDFNQALMELGQRICTARSPRCLLCPLRTGCVACRLGLQDQLPTRVPRPPTVAVQEAAVVTQRAGRVLLVQRPPEGRWGGLWEFPHGPLEAGEPPSDAARRLAALAGIRIGPAREILVHEHGVTRWRIRLHCFTARQRAGTFRSDFYRQGRWLKPAELRHYPVSAPQRVLAERLDAG